MPQKTQSQNKISALFNKIKSSKKLSALTFAVIFGIAAAAYLLVSHAAAVPVIGMVAMPDHSGYYLAETNGTVVKFDTNNGKGTTVSKAVSTAQPIVDIAINKAGDGGWLMAADGGVVPWGNAKSLGQHYTPASTDYAAIVVTPSGAGYWEVTKAGIVFPVGDAATTYKLDTTKTNYKTTSFATISGVDEIVDADTNLNGKYLNMLDKNGKIYTIGQTSNYGNVPLHTGESAAAIDSHIGGTSYVVATDYGRIQAFGGFSNVGDMYGKKLWAPVIGLTVFGSTATKDMSYWMAATDGGVFSFGQAHFYGSIATPQPATTTLSVSPTSINQGGSVTVTWTSANAAKCSLNGAAVALSGKSTQKPNNTTVYNLSCVSNSNVATTKSVTATVILPPPPPVTSGGGGGGGFRGGGGCGTDICVLQAALHLSVDGSFGPQTASACLSNFSHLSTALQYVCSKYVHIPNFQNSGNPCTNPTSHACLVALQQELSQNPQSFTPPRGGGAVSTTASYSGHFVLGEGHHSVCWDNVYHQATSIDIVFQRSDYNPLGIFGGADNSSTAEKTASFNYWDDHVCYNFYWNTTYDSADFTVSASKSTIYNVQVH